MTPAGGPATSPTPRDPGLQPERTSLAWQRSGVNAALVSGLAVLVALRRGQPALVVTTAVIAAASAAVAGVTVWQATRERGTWPQPPSSPGDRLLAVALVVAAAAVVGVALALT